MTLGVTVTADHLLGLSTILGTMTLPTTVVTSITAAATLGAIAGEVTL